MRTLPYLPFLFVAGFASQSFAQTGQSLDSAWSRTPIPFRMFTDADVDEVPTVVTSTRTGSAVPVLWQLPAQAMVTCYPSGGSHYYACWSQDPAASITSSAYFNADADGVYTEGDGPCMLGVSGTPYIITGAVPLMFRPQSAGGSWPPGSRKGTCPTTGEPCAANGECTTGTCSYATLPTTAYLFVGCADSDCPCSVMDVR
jgi:hypothetical protein